jgi:hypothetical protein
MKATTTKQFALVLLQKQIRDVIFFAMAANATKLRGGTLPTVGFTLPLY